MVFLEKLVLMVVSSGVYTRNFNFLSCDNFPHQPCIDRQELPIAFPFLFPKLRHCN